MSMAKFTAEEVSSLQAGGNEVSMFTFDLTIYSSLLFTIYVYTLFTL